MNMKGALPLLILHLLSCREYHGYEIAHSLKGLSRNLLDFKDGALYPTLKRLESDGCLTSYTQEYSGRLRRYYRITDAGRALKLKQEKAWHNYVEAVNNILIARE